MRILDTILFFISVLFYFALLPFVVAYLYALCFIGMAIAGSRTAVRDAASITRRFVANDAMCSVTVRGRRRIVTITPDEMPPLRWR